MVNWNLEKPGHCTKQKRLTYYYCGLNHFTSNIYRADIGLERGSFYLEYWVSQHPPQTKTKKTSVLSVKRNAKTWHERARQTWFAFWVCVPGFLLHDKSIRRCKFRKPRRNFAAERSQDWEIITTVTSIEYGILFHKEQIFLQRGYSTLTTLWKLLSTTQQLAPVLSLPV